MKRLDCSCFVGGWPFHLVRSDNFSALRELHRENGISGGFVSSTDAIFYNDPYEVELKLAGTLCGEESYRHVMTVNPTLPGTWDSLRRAVREMGIAGVRVLPGFHDFSLRDPEMGRLCGLLRDLKLPLFLTLRMEDERVTYLFHPRSVPMEDVRSFLKEQIGFPVLLSNIRQHELIEVKDALLARPGTVFDCCGLKDSMFAIEQMEEERLAERMVYGSLAPIYCLKSTVMLLEQSGISNQRRDEIFSARALISPESC